MRAKHWNESDQQYLFIQLEILKYIYLKLMITNPEKYTFLQYSPNHFYWNHDSYNFNKFKFYLKYLKKFQNILNRIEQCGPRWT